MRPGIQHVTVIGEWVITVLATMYIGKFLINGVAAHHAQNPALAGLKAGLD